MLNITFSSNAETSLLLHDWNVGVKLYPINKPLLISIKKTFFVSPISLIKKICTCIIHRWYNLYRWRRKQSNIWFVFISVLISNKSRVLTFFTKLFIHMRERYFCIVCIFKNLPRVERSFGLKGSRNDHAVLLKHFYYSLCDLTGKHYPITIEKRRSKKTRNALFLTLSSRLSVNLPLTDIVLQPMYCLCIN